ncbi:ictacalcin-like isoform X1 [Salvelinus alpinus]|uniref:ictacalcin-like isoform X1 n=2 Tax=Salvelinus alpinus TaxID=8036 RepID=UPI0039FC3DED
MIKGGMEGVVMYKTHPSLHQSLTISLSLTFYFALSFFPHLVTMSGIQQAMSLLIASFHKYSGKEGDKLTLSKVELKELLQAELGEMLGKASDKSAVDIIFKDLDSNKDNTVDFKEYVTLVSCLTVMCNDFFVKK